MCPVRAGACAWRVTYPDHHRNQEQDGARHLRRLGDARLAARRWEARQDLRLATRGAAATGRPRLDVPVVAGRPNALSIHALVDGHGLLDGVAHVLWQRRHLRRRRALRPLLDAARLLHIVCPAAPWRSKLGAVLGARFPGEHRRVKGQAKGIAVRLHDALGVLEQVVRVDDHQRGALGELLEVVEQSRHGREPRLGWVKVSVARLLVVNARLEVEGRDGLRGVADHERVAHRRVVAAQQLLEVRDAVRRDVIRQVLGEDKGLALGPRVAEYCLCHGCVRRRGPLPVLARRTSLAAPVEGHTEWLVHNMNVLIFDEASLHGGRQRARGAPHHGANNLLPLLRVLHAHVGVSAHRRVTAPRRCDDE